jgi:hypothetical protein
MLNAHSLKKLIFVIPYEMHDETLIASQTLVTEEKLSSSKYLEPVSIPYT